MLNVNPFMGFGTFHIIRIIYFHNRKKIEHTVPRTNIIHFEYE